MNVFEYCQLTPVPCSLAIPVGWPVKTCKSKLLSCFECNLTVEILPQQNAAYHILDGNAVVHYIGKLSSTFGQLAELFFSMLPKVESVDFVTDT